MVERYLEANSRFDPVVLGQLRHGDWYADWPQSGERIPGHAADVAVHTLHPDYPAHLFRRAVEAEEQRVTTSMLNLTRITELGPIVVVEVRLEYAGEGSWDNVTIVEFRQRQVLKETAYFCQTFDPPQWRAQWVRPLSGDNSFTRASEWVNPQTESAHRQAVIDYLATPLESYGEAARNLFHGDVETIWPQSGERIEGIDDLISIATHHPASPRASVRRVSTIGNLAVAEVAVNYGGESWFEVMVLEFKGDHVARSTEYFAEAFDPPRWRQSLTVPLP